MRPDYIRSTRIDTLFKKALTGKYTWDQLLSLALAMGVTKPTAKSYITSVEGRLHQKGYLKKK